MQIISRYNKERKTLAHKCAEYLGLKPIPEELYKIGVKVSDLPSNPDLINEDNLSIQENSLLSIGLVYSHNNLLNFIDLDGHTIILPQTDLIKETLEKSGYLICEYGKSTPYFSGYPNTEENYRNKYTLPPQLVQEIKNIEPNTQLKFYKGTRAEHTYDVFAKEFYRGSIIDEKYIISAACYLDPKNQISRILLSFLYGFSSKRNQYLNHRNLTSYINELFDKDKILNDDLYFTDNGLYIMFKEEQEKRRSLVSKQTTSLPTITVSTDEKRLQELEILIPYLQQQLSILEREKEELSKRVKNYKQK